MTNSRVIQKLRAGEVARMINLSRVTDPWLTEVAGRMGQFDVVWLDLEHRTFEPEVIAPMALACRATGMDLLVRVRKADYSSPMQALESGANAIMVPHCRSAAEAAQWVEWCRFPPLGKRGLDGAGADADYGLAPILEHIAHANRETLLALQIEDREAVECVDEIAAVPGVDLLFVGPGDLSMSYGVPMHLDHDLLQTAIRRVAAAAADAGKWWGIATGSVTAAQDAVDLGARLITCGSDHGWLLAGLREAARSFAGVGIGRPQVAG